MHRTDHTKCLSYLRHVVQVAIREGGGDRFPGQAIEQSFATLLTADCFSLLLYVGPPFATVRETPTRLSALVARTGDLNKLSPTPPCKTVGEI